MKVSSIKLENFKAPANVESVCICTIDSTFSFPVYIVVSGGCVKQVVPMWVLRNLSSKDIKETEHIIKKVALYVRNDFAYFRTYYNKTQFIDWIFSILQ